MRSGGIAVFSALIAYLLGPVSFICLFTRLWVPRRDVTGLEAPVDGTEEQCKVLSISGKSVGLVLEFKAGMNVKRGLGRGLEGVALPCTKCEPSREKSCRENRPLHLIADILMSICQSTNRSFSQCHWQPG